MGVWNPGFASCSNNAEAPAPNPKNFKVISVTHCGNGHVVIVDYPDCTNYEGRKVLVYKGKYAITQTRDPHFTSLPETPFARFEPTPEGISTAIAVAKSL